ncbi:MULTISPECIES: gas vesicle protein GvpJ [Saliphagus]|uniref:Gas vesicle protein GvpJ n=1 Tax=Saliphagus infecundisoli TaxID=1849069 RepID=A0ABD5QG47_9EURY|nr:MULTISPECIES: gas vesicle protein [Saliphagus]
MVDSVQPSRQQADLAEVVEMLLDKGVVINADIAVSVGDTQLLGIQLRAALASFETAAEYGLEFPEGTDMERVAAAVGDPSIAEEEATAPIDATRGVNVSEESEANDRSTDSRSARPDPETPTGGDVDVFDGGPLDTDDGSESEDGSENDDGGADERAEAEAEPGGDGGGGGE